MSTEKSFLDWDSLLSPEEVYADTIGISHLTHSPEGVLYWVESRAAEKGRCTIVRLENGKINEVTPKVFNVRTRVHEYGGTPYWVCKNYIYFINFSDQRIYKQDVHNIDNTIPLTPDKIDDGSIGKYMDVTATPDETKLFFVYEQEFEDHSIPKNTLAVIDLTKEGLQKPEVLVEGNDFYSEFRMSEDGTKCCWLTWNLPNMPWDYTELWIADITSAGLENSHKIAGGNGESINSPVFSAKNDVFFAMDYPGKTDNDYQNYWNIFKYTDKLAKVHPVTKEFVEFGQPMWVSGNTNFRFLNENTMICLYRKNGKSKLATLNLPELKLTKLEIPYNQMREILVYNQQVYLTAGSPTSPAVLTSFELKDFQLVNEQIIIKTLSDRNILANENVSIGKLISFPTKDGEKGYGYLYLPKNNNYKSVGKPPLLVLVHGGPTGNSFSIYNNYDQYWTSSGFAIFDIEYRGSTGFGRRYRDKLLGEWGVLEISDIEDAISYLKAKGVISNQVAITGGSAGGYTVQRALTALPDLFQVGASHYGIGNLETLVKLTHKFESKYLDRIISEDIEIIKDRSPINHLDQLKAPMIIFQGSDDKVVHPDVSREMAKILKEKGVKSDYIEYAGEGHGFRQLDNKVDALKRESAFFKEVLKALD